MKLLKSAIVAFSLALSLGSFSTTAVACEDGRTCVGNVQAIDLIVGRIAEASRGITDGDDAEAILTLIKQAQNYSKEVNANDKVDISRQRANRFLKKAKKAIKAGKLDEAVKILNEAEQRFAALKGML